MKKNLLFAAAAGIMLFSACSNDEDVIIDGANDVNVSGEITLALNAGGNGTESRAARPVYSSEAYSEVTDVELKLFKKNGENWVAATGVTTDLAEGWAISNWGAQSAVSPGTTDNVTTKTVKLKDLDKSAEYKLVAYGYKKELKTTLDWTAALAVATPNAGEDVEEIFAREEEFSTNDEGKISTTPVLVEMRREVAGVLGYFKNIPEKVGKTTVKSVCVYASSSNTAYNIPSLSLQNQCGTAAGTERVTVLNLPIPTEGVTVVEGIYNWAGKDETNLKTEANSLLGGCFLVPFAKVEGKATFTIALCDENGNDLKTWTGVLDQTQTGEDDTKIFNVNRNYFYSFGKKLKAGTTRPNPENPDEPIDLSVNTEITIILNNAWGVIHNMGIEEN